MNRKETAWKKSRKFGDVMGGRSRPKLADNIFKRYHSLEKPNETVQLPIFIRDNPSRDFFYPLTEKNILGKLKELPHDDTIGITHVWLRKVKKEDYQFGETFQGCFISGSGVNLIVLSAFPKNMRMIMGESKPNNKTLKLYSKWTTDLRFDKELDAWYLNWEPDKIRDYYLNYLLLHEVAHFVDRRDPKSNSNANQKRSEDFAENYARIWHHNGRETIQVE